VFFPAVVGGRTGDAPAAETGIAGVAGKSGVETWATRIIEARASWAKGESRKKSGTAWVIKARTALAWGCASVDGVQCGEQGDRENEEGQKMFHDGGLLDWATLPPAIEQWICHAKSQEIPNAWRGQSDTGGFSARRIWVKISG